MLLKYNHYAAVNKLLIGNVNSYILVWGMLGMVCAVIVNDTHLVR